MFIDGIDEVTSYFEGVEDITEAVHRVNTEADVVWVDGHSDYGHALEVFWEKWGREVGPKTTVILLGDARNNYHAAEPGCSRRCVTALATSTGSTLSPARTGTPATRSSVSTASTPTASSSAATSGSSSGSSRTSPENPRVTRLLLVRHGESQVYVDGLVGGLATCNGLSDLGRRQAAALGDRLASTHELDPVDVLIASTLPRARQTAQIISPAIGNLPVIEDEEVCEIHPGEADGLAYDDYASRSTAGATWRRTPSSSCPPAGRASRRFMRVSALR